MRLGSLPGCERAVRALIGALTAARSQASLVIERAGGSAGSTVEELPGPPLERLHELSLRIEAPTRGTDWGGASMYLKRYLLDPSFEVSIFSICRRLIAK